MFDFALCEYYVFIKITQISYEVFTITYYIADAVYVLLRATTHSPGGPALFNRLFTRCPPTGLSHYSPDVLSVIKDD